MEPKAMTSELGSSTPPSLHKTVRFRDMVDFEHVVWDRGANVHNDHSAATADGMSAPIASGQLQMAYIHELLEREYGGRWTHGGAISARWLAPVYAEDTLLVQITGQESNAESSATVVTVSCTNQEGTQTGAATATIPYQRSNEAEEQ